MTGKPNTNVLIICLTSVVLLIIGGIIGIDVAGRSTSNFLSSLFGFVATALPASAALWKAVGTGQKVDQVQHTVNGQMTEQIRQKAALVGELAKADPGNSVLKNITEKKVS